MVLASVKVYSPLQPTMRFAMTGAGVKSAGILLNLTAVFQTMTAVT